jgi:hypothetical protein
MTLAMFHLTATIDWRGIRCESKTSAIYLRKKTNLSGQTVTCYINKKDKGIRQIDLHVYNEKPERYMLVAKMDTLNVNAKIAYTKIDGRYMLDYISQTTYASGKLFGSHQNLVYSTTADVVDRQTNLKMNEIVMKTEVDDVNEKTGDIKELKSSPDMK